MIRTHHALEINVTPPTITAWHVGFAPNILNDIVGRDHVHYIKDLDWNKRKDYVFTLLRLFKGGTA